MTGQALRSLLGDWPDVPWHDLPAETVPLKGIVPTQWPHYDPCALCRLRLGRPSGGLPRVIQWRGRLFAWDGHHRIALLLRAGVESVTARVWRIDEEAA